MSNSTRGGRAVAGERRHSRRARRVSAVSSMLIIASGLVAVTGAPPAAAPTAVPGVPGTPVAYAMGGAAALRWSAPADVGSPPLTRYRIEVNGGSGWATKPAVPGTTSISGGALHSCALLDDGAVKCWGGNPWGQLGLGDTTYRGDNAGEMGDSLPAVDLGTGRTAVAIADGYYHSCALLDNGAVKCWGDNSQGPGQLGLGDSDNRGDDALEMGNSLPAVQLGTGRTAVAIAAGNFHSCALLDNGKVKCWGDNALGQLGLGDVEDRGDGTGEMGNDLPAIALGTGRTAVAIALGTSHSCALLDNGKVKCWGDNALGQLGLGDVEDRGDGPGEMGNSLPTVALGTGRTAVAITAGNGDSCALLDNGKVKCWGRNNNGQLGLGDTDTRGDGPGEMGNNLPTVALGTGRTAVAITSGYYHSCALLDNDTMKCWGYNEDGQLGLGDISNRGNAPAEMGDSLPVVALGAGRAAVAISARYMQSCARLDDGTSKCWGRNLEGQLGLGDTALRGDDPGEMGDSLPAVSLGASRNVSAPSAAVVRLTPGTYRFRVVAVSAIGEGTPSGASASVTIPGPPAAPRRVKAVSGSTAKATGSLRVSFRAGASNGSAITGYTARCASSNGGATRSKSGSASPLTVTRVTTGKRYTCQARATNVRGTGVWSARSPAVIVGSPAAPRHVRAVKIAAGSLRVSFTSGASNGRAITGFTGRCASSNGGAARSKTGTASPVKVAHLTAGKKYTCTARATNSRGTGLASAPSPSVRA